MKPYQWRIAVSSAALLLFTLQIEAAPPTTAELLRKLPENTNAVVVINVRDIVKTPRGIKEGWGQKEQMEFLAGAIPVHPSIERVVIGSQFDPYNPGQSWYVAVVPVTKPVSMDKLALKYNSMVEDIGGESAVFTNQVGYVVQLGENLVGTIGSNDRQSVSRWIRFAKTNEKASLPLNLRTALSRHPNAHIVMAIDADDLINPKSVRMALIRSKLFAGNDKLTASAEKFLGKLHTVRFTAQIGDTIKARLYFDSGVPATKDLEVLKPFFIEVMARAGAELEDLPAAAVTFDDRSVIMDFSLSNHELGEIMALMSSPLIHPDPEQVTSLALTTEGVDVAASERYYRAVNQLVDDLRKQTKRATDYTRTALWHETSARKIGQLSILHVDKRVLAYGSYVGARLQAIADSLRGVPIQLEQLEAQKYVYYYGNLYYGPGGRLWLSPYSVSAFSNIPQMEHKQLEAIKKDADNRTKLWLEVDSERSSVRAAMVEKYKIEFGATPKKQ